VKPAPPAPSFGKPDLVVVAPGRRDPHWDDDILDILDEEPDHGGVLGILARQLAELGKRAPVFGYELGKGRWQADFAWFGPRFKIAVVADPAGSDPDARHRDEAYAQEGWTMRTATEWLEHLDELEELLPDTAMEDSQS